jgi:peptidoglycan hydrolase CwlO-like protein
MGHNDSSRIYRTEEFVGKILKEVTSIKTSLEVLCSSVARLSERIANVEGKLDFLESEIDEREYDL